MNTGVEKGAIWGLGVGVGVGVRSEEKGTERGNLITDTGTDGGIALH